MAGLLPSPDRPLSRRDRRAGEGTAGGRSLAVGLTAIAVVAAVLRTWNLADRPVEVDEPLVVERALRVLHGDLAAPGTYPPLVPFTVAAVVGAARLVGAPASAEAAYLPSQLLMVAASLGTVVLTGALAAILAGPGRRRVVVGAAAAGAVALSFLAVRMGNYVKPDVLQAMWMLAAVLAAVRHERSPTLGAAVAGGAFAGLAAASKYAGALVFVPVAVALVTRPGAGARRFVHLAAAATGVVAAFVVGTLGTVLTHPARFRVAVLEELRHQADGHLGYEPASPGWWFHATESLPGNWGWVLTAVGLGGAAALLLRGSRVERLVSGTALLAFAVAGLSAVQFPHYVLMAVPFLAVTAGAAAGKAAVLLPRMIAAPLVAIVVLSVVPTVVDDVRLVRAWGAARTEAAAAVLKAEVAAPLWAEGYTGEPTPGERTLGSVGRHPETLDCRCVLALSSYQEERFRRRPDLYADEVAVYDAVRRHGRVVAVVAPDQRLPYRWDLLPQWGLRRIPLTGEVGRVGPTVTLVDLREPEEQGPTRSAA